jgi:phosphoribosylanthranilate isomerase
MTRIKICGIKTEEHALGAAAAGADFIGLVFAQSPRQINPAQAKKIVDALKGNKAHLEVVGVFVNAHVGTVKRIADSCRLDWIQLSGDEPWEYCRELARPVIKVIRVGRNYQPEPVCKHLTYGRRILGELPHIFLIDSSDREKYGGTGLTFDWELAQPIAQQFPVIVAGGLTPGNVAQAIRIIAPWGVDVSTGVETKGIKDMNKINKFIESVRKADGQTG